VKQTCFHLHARNTKYAGNTGTARQLRNTSASAARRICDTHAGRTAQNMLKTAPQKRMNHFCGQ